MDDLEQYLELVLKMYELSPEGVPEGTCARVCLLVMSIHAFVGVIKGNRCTHTHTLNLLLEGEHSIAFLANVFAKLDAEAEFNLSNRKTKKDRNRWYLDEALFLIVHVVLCVGIVWMYCMCMCIVWKAYSLYGLLSFARRYWRKACSRGTRGEAHVVFVFSWGHASAILCVSCGKLVCTHE